MIKYEQVEDKIILLRGQKVILDSDVAYLYGVETKHINQAVRNNSEKFPKGYVIELKENEWGSVKSKFLTSPLGGGKVKRPNAFTEKGLYMLATILKSEQATKTTLTIIEAFSKLRELSNTVKGLSSSQDEGQKKGFIRRSGELMTELFDDDLFADQKETTLEVNFILLKLKRTVKKTKKA